MRLVVGVGRYINNELGEVFFFFFFFSFLIYLYLIEMDLYSTEKYKHT